MQESTSQSCRLLEERDYIGLSEASSVLEMRSPVKGVDSHLQDTDLQLGLGLGLCVGSSGCKELSRGSALNLKNGAKRGYSEVADESRVHMINPSWHAGPFKPLPSPDSSSQDSATDDPPPSKGQVVGWPPVCMYRRQTLSKPAEMFVKVNMDGMTVGRKVDLNAYTSYESLLGALEEMFQPSHSGRESELKHFLLSSGSDFVLTYEDKEGDWMLVGDVPWSMFTSTVRRLRITRGSEAKGTVLSRPHTLKSTFRA